ncbi:hypothetical protein BofuT4_uP011730.1 [Botrytis cinerea T4]|uniref:Uncharacterized protein n=1 Tax=Botryotinia fuckeliana (strain T4) TaxID=999810 RepID=G2XS60_BOTF4|nr:hypothetical protein BofuT4_uP011730.1 [Botrytis cinerea T4]
MSHRQRQTHHSSRRRESERREARDRWSHADPNHPIELREIRREQGHTPRRSEVRQRRRRKEEPSGCCVIM